MVAARALIQESQRTAPEALPQSSESSTNTVLTKFKAWSLWAVGKLKGRFWWELLLTFVSGAFLTRPMLYAVLGKFITVSIKLLIRQSMGTITTVFDAVLDEMSFQLDAVMVPSTHVKMGMVPATLPVPPAPLQWWSH